MEDRDRFGWHPGAGKLGDMLFNGYDRGAIYLHELRHNMARLGVAVDMKAELPDFTPPEPGDEYDPDWSEMEIDEPEEEQE